MNVEIIFKNEHWCAVLKPAEMLSVPSRLGKADQRLCLKYLLSDQMNHDMLPIHRLDFEVSGLILFAFTKEAHRIGNSWFEKSLIQKSYQAISQGSLSLAHDQVGLWKSRILRGKRRAYESPHGDEALTESQVLGEWPGGNVEWQLLPKTGRSHQLRFEMFKHDFPILGDQLYGSQISLPTGSGIALRALRLEVRSEVTEGLLGLPRMIECEKLKPVDIGIK